MVKNPSEYISFGRKDAKQNGKVLSFQCNLSLLTDNDYDEYTGPMQIFNDRYSKWKLNLSQTGENKGGAAVNINLNRFYQIQSDTQICNQILANLRMNEKKSQIPDELKVSIKYLPSNMSDGKGHTAIQLAKEYSFGDCLAAADVLDKNAASGGKYAANNAAQAKALRTSTLIVAAQKIMINGERAADLFTKDSASVKAYIQANPNSDESKQLSIIGKMITMNYKAGVDIRPSLCIDLGSEETGNSYVLFEEFKTPHIDTVDENGRTDATDVKIICNFGAEAPYHIEITNMKGEPIKGAKVGINRRNATDIHRFVFDLLPWEWTAAVDGMSQRIKGLTYARSMSAYRSMIAERNKNFRPAVEQ